MLWFALELTMSNQKMGLIIKSSLWIAQLTAFKSNGVAKFVNTGVG